MEQQSEFTEAFLVYCYQKGKSWFYYKMDSLELNDGTLANENSALRFVNYNEALFTNQNSGSIYPVKFSDSGTVSYNKKRMPVGYWKNTVERIKWRSLDNASKLEKQVLKGIKENVIAEALDPVRLAYQQADWRQKSLILAEAIRYITNR